MNKFKAGDKVKRICSSHEGMTIGDVAIVRMMENGSNMYLEGYGYSHDPGNFELVEETEKESTAKWLKQNKWWIKCESQAELDLINPWLKENFGDTLGVRVPDIIKYVCNDFTYPNLVFWGYEDKPKNQEITLEFGTIVKSFTLPVVETEQEKKIRELQETIDKASAQIKAIKEGM